jgi:hypothetical protein
MSFYEVGLNNVGSYQVSGRPWLKSVTLAPGEATSVLFPSVTKNIKVTNKSSTGEMKLAFGDFESSNVSRAINFNSSGNFVSPTITRNGPFSFSFWVNLVELGPTTRLRLFSTSTSNYNRIDANGVDNTTIQFYLFINGISNTGLITVPNRTELLNNGQDLWVHVVLTSDGANNNKLYVNGSNIITNTTTQQTPDVDKIYLPSSTAFYLGSYDELTYWEKQLSEPEVLELNSSGDYYDPRTHSANASLKSWWAFEDSLSNTEFNDDTSIAIKDRISSYNLTGTGTVDFIDSPFSLSGVETGKHYLTILPNSSVFLSCKSSVIYLRAGLEAPQNFEIIASLTNIPSSQMYELTGPGIDE